MLSNRKAQGMSLNTVIIAIIVLIVLVVLIMIFTGYFGKIFTPTVGNCATQGGMCTTQCNTETAGSEIFSAKGCQTSQKCCASVSSIAEVATPTAAAAATTQADTGGLVKKAPPATPGG